MPQPVQVDAAHVDLSSRVFQTNVVAGSPALAAETTIATLTITGDLAIQRGAFVWAFAAFTLGTSGTSYRLRIRRDTIAGLTIADTGLVNATAANLYAPSIFGYDTTALGVAQVYVCTLQVAAGAAVSTVSAVNMVAVAV